MTNPDNGRAAQAVRYNQLTVGGLARRPRRKTTTVEAACVKAVRQIRTHQRTAGSITEPGGLTVSTSDSKNWLRKQQ
jgi:hypothetical protein